MPESLQACNFIEKETLALVFSKNFLRTPFLQNISGRLLLEFKCKLSRYKCLWTNFSCVVHFKNYTFLLSIFVIVMDCKWPKYCIFTVWQLTARKMKFSIKDFFSKCDQIHSFLRISSCILKKSLIESFTFCAATFPEQIPIIRKIPIIFKGHHLYQYVVWYCVVSFSAKKLCSTTCLNFSAHKISDCDFCISQDLFSKISDINESPKIPK